MCLWFAEVRSNLDSEKAARHDAEQKLLNVEKEKNEMNVDVVQFQQQVAALKQELQAESNKNRSQSQQLEQEAEKRKLLQADIKTHLHTITQLKATENQSSQECRDLRQDKKNAEDELRKVKE